MQDHDQLYLGEDCQTDAGQTDTWSFGHAYRLVGSWAIRATLTLDCGLEDANPPFTAAASVIVIVGATPSNGPFRPTAWLAPTPPRPGSSSPSLPPPPPGTAEPILVPLRPAGPERSYGSFLVGADDYDGYLTRVVIRWGDRSKDTVLTFGLDGCTEPLLKEHWPASELSRTIKHRFRRGTYTSTLTATTTGCDGRDPQVVTVKLRHAAQ